MRGSAGRGGKRRLENGLEMRGEGGSSRDNGGLRRRKRRWGWGEKKGDGGGDRSFGETEKGGVRWKYSNTNIWVCMQPSLCSNFDLTFDAILRGLGFSEKFLSIL